MRRLIDVRIEHGAIEHLNDPAKSEVREAIKCFGEDLLNEAGRLEAMPKVQESTPEITSTIIKDAVIFLRKGYVRRRPPRWEMFVRFGSVTAALLTGVLTQFMSEDWGPITVMAAFGATVILEAWLLAREYYS